jgi:hypothetical protein
MKDSILEILEARDFLTKKSTNFSYAFLNFKYFLSALIFSSLTFIMYFIYVVAFDNNLFSSSSSFVYAINVLTLLSSFIILFACMSILLDSSNKLILNSEKYINGCFSSEELLYLKKILPELEKEDISNYKRKFQKKIAEINKQLSKKETLEDFHALLINDSDAAQKYMELFEYKLKVFNKVQKNKAKKTKSINRELKEAGLTPFENKEEALDLKIKEAE